MDISSLMNPIGSNGPVVKSRKRSAEPLPAHSEPEPKRARIELNGYELHPTDQQGQGTRGLYKVPSAKKMREVPRFAQKYMGGAKLHIQPRPSSLPSDFPDYKGPRPEKPRAPSSSHGINGQERHPPGSSGQGSTASPAVTNAPPPQPTTWEANILDHVALDQISRTVADWLFTTVVDSPNLGPNAAWEVEAKLGHLIDQGTNERLQLPALTDFVLNRSTGPRVAFKSTMTEAQHRSFNGFLNDALMRSLPPKDGSPVEKPRIPISYKHTRQTDTFYDLPMSEAKQHLPASALSLANQTDRSRMPRVRVSTDQKTGTELGRIVKLRIGDLDIHSPTTLFDVRISANIEVNYGGSIEELERITAQNDRRRNPARSKDRMTYNHLAYQIDLTQVIMADVCPPFLIGSIQANR
jgi:mRNA capping enzyme, beta chain